MKQYTLPKKTEINLCYNPELISQENTEKLMTFLSNFELSGKMCMSNDDAKYVNMLLETRADPRATSLTSNKTVLNYLMEYQRYDLVVKVLKMGVFSEGILAPCLDHSLYMDISDYGKPKKVYNYEILELLKKQGFSEKERSPEYISYLYNRMMKHVNNTMQKYPNFSSKDLPVKAEKCFQRKVEFLCSPYSSFSEF